MKKMILTLTLILSSTALAQVEEVCENSKLNKTHASAEMSFDENCNYTKTYTVGSQTCTVSGKYTDYRRSHTKGVIFLKDTSDSCDPSYTGGVETVFIYDLSTGSLKLDQ